VVEAVVTGFSDRIKSVSVALVVGRGSVDEPKESHTHAALINDFFPGKSHVTHLDSVGPEP
jgi:hypothetical protein